MRKEVYHISLRTSQMINIVRLIMIIGVIYVHTIPVLKAIDSPIITAFSFLMRGPAGTSGIALFFFLSSILTYKKIFTFKSNFRKKCLSLLLPYIAFISFWILVVFVMQLYDPLLTLFHFDSQVVLWGKPVIQWTPLDWLDAYTGFVYGTPFVYPFWFIRDLFLVNIFASLIKKAIDLSPYISGIILLAISIALMQIGTYGLTLFSFALGYYVIKFGISLERVANINIGLILVSYVAITVCFLIPFRYTYSIFVFPMVIVGGILYLRIGYYLIDSKHDKILLQIAPWSFGVFCFHEYFLRFFRKIASMIIPQIPFLVVIEYCTLPLVLCIFCLFICKTLNSFPLSPIKMLLGGRVSKSSKKVNK
ncbi:acyltransferase family protein [Bifidobacterium sp. UBA744]|uniref:acyltransferase family protein n=1 Tax=Bifidobacterium sp. UBA744 TaxID=1946112 RepID=UPI0025BAA5C4|nr:acyltransferase family protein [Bifidobacterium sp. UBA744]